MLLPIIPLPSIYFNDEPFKLMLYGKG